MKTGRDVLKFFKNVEIVVEKNFKTEIKVFQKLKY